MGCGVVLHKLCQDRGFTLRLACRGCTKQQMKQQVHGSCSSPIVIVVMVAMVIVMMIFMIMCMMIMIVMFIVTIAMMLMIMRFNRMFIFHCGDNASDVHCDGDSHDYDYDGIACHDA